MDINVFYETFLWISIQMSLIYELFPELQDFNDYHKKIKAKIHEDIRFYNKFIETALELSGKFNTFKEFSCLLKYFLKNLSKIIKKCPFLFKTTMNPLQVNLLRVLAKPNFESTSKVYKYIKNLININIIIEFNKMLCFLNLLLCSHK